MIKLTEFKIKTSNGETVLGEYEGNEKSGKVVVFSHGFGVTRTDHGMFTDLGDFLKGEYLVVRFDYNLINDKGKSMEVFPYSQQSRMLDAVLKFVKSSFKTKKVNLIAHSQGSLVVGVLQPSGINKTVLISTPLRSPYQRFKSYFSQRPGTKFDEEGKSQIQRSDGSTTYINKDFWPEIKSIKPLELFRRLAEKYEVSVIIGKDDDLVTDRTPVEVDRGSVSFFEIVGGHDFGGSSRSKLMQLISRVLEKN